MGALQPAALLIKCDLVLGTSFLDSSLSGTWPNGWRQLVAGPAPCPLLTLMLSPVTSRMSMPRRALNLRVLTSLCLHLRSSSAPLPPGPTSLLFHDWAGKCRCAGL